MSFMIEKVFAREILDSRGNPTLETEIISDTGLTVQASVPSGASTGSREAVELRDNDFKRFGGKGVLKAVTAVNSEIYNAVKGMDCRRQRAVDECMIRLDGTRNKSRIGANSILGVSLAVSRLAAQSSSLPLYKYLGGPDTHLLPVPCMNVINGGIHARWQGADFQEYMIAPWGAATFSEALRWGSEIYQSLRSILTDAGLSVGIGDEGGFAPIVASNREPLELMIKAIEKTGLKPGNDVAFCLDPASTGFYKEGKYFLRRENRSLTPQEMIAYYENLIEDFPVVLLEDGLAEDDWAGWHLLNAALGNKIELVGDDLFVTNTEYIEWGIREHLANAALIKLNQIGTLTETIDAVKLCRKHSWATFISHRSGETVDSYIADMAVAFDAGHIKSGAPCRGERLAKYNRLMRIEQELGAEGIYAGKNAFRRSADK